MKERSLSLRIKNEELLKRIIKIEFSPRRMANKNKSYLLNAESSPKEGIHLVRRRKAKRKIEMENKEIGKRIINQFLFINGPGKLKK